MAGLDGSIVCSNLDSGGGVCRKIQQTGSFVGAGSDNFGSILLVNKDMVSV